MASKAVRWPWGITSSAGDEEGESELRFKILQAVSTLKKEESHRVQFGNKPANRRTSLSGGPGVSELAGEEGGLLGLGFLW